jgi:D-alanyl-D-alanine carboxypeptidase
VFGFDCRVLERCSGLLRRLESFLGALREPVQAHAASVAPPRSSIDLTRPAGAPAATAGWPFLTYDALVAMQLVPRRPRLLLCLVVIGTVAAVGLFANRSGPALSVHARAAAAANVATDLPRPAWFGMRILSDGVTFEPVVPAASAPVIHALAGILVDIDTGTILWQQDAHTELPPASTTKILTALVALENFPPTQRVTVTAAALHQAWDESRMGLKAGETLTIRELLTGMLLVSGNDAATAIAVDTVGMERFVAAMNAQVASLDLHDSHFTNPVGLQDAGLHTSAYDLAAISTAAVRNFATFRDIVVMRRDDLAASAGHPVFRLRSINALLGMYPAAVGIKPGWTAAAGYCEVGMAVRDGHRLISVVLNAPYSASQSEHLLDWGFVQEGLTSTLPTPTALPSPHG